MKISKVKIAASVDADKTRIVAADEDTDLADTEGIIISDDEDDMGNQLDAIQDQVEDIQDSVEDIQEDDSNIEVDNNIDGHYIAECDRCHGIFISAVIESDQEVEKITGVCPLCEKETEQFLKWVISSVNKD